MTSSSRCFISQRPFASRPAATLTVFFITSLLIAVVAAAQQAGQPPRPTIYWPQDVAVDNVIPTPKQFFGFEIGHRHLRHDQVVAYLRAVAAASPRVELAEYGKSHGGRPLLLLTITSPANHERIGEIRAAHRRLTKANADRISIDDLPMVMNMGYGVHGDESSATNTAPLVAHYLAAAQGDEINRILDQCVILLDPSLNPDGFDRFARWANTFRGRVPNPDPAHVEHNQGWPPGRVNYYWFDLNRDWLPLQHPESRARMRWYHAWKPNVVLDFHEMGTNSTFFFQPGIPQRTNPLTPRDNIELTREIAKYHARDLDQIGSLYFTQEVFDDFYMGKGSTYPDLHGSIGILFEQGSSRGHVQENQNGVIRFSDTIRNQFTASLSSLRAAADLREKLIEYKRDFYQTSLDQAARHPVKAYVFQAADNRSRLQAFADILLRHDLKCFWAEQDTVVDGRAITAGSLVVPAEQSEFVFLRSLVERRKQFRESIFYDVSAWTLPLAFNLKQINLKQAIDTRGLPAAKLGARQANEFEPGQTPVAYLIDWRDDRAPQVLQQLLANGAKVKVARKPFAVLSDGQSKEFSFGTISIPSGLNGQPRRWRRIEQILKQAARSGVRVSPVDSGLATSGIDLGSNNFPTVEPRSVALVIGRGMSAYQAGQVWHQLDHRIGMPVTMIDHRRMESADLSRYTTIVLVSGFVNWSDAGIDELRRWVTQGGTLVAMGGGAAMVEQRLLTLTASPQTAATERTTDGEPPDAPESGPKPERPRFVDARASAALALISGAIFQTEIDTSHPLCFGFTEKHLPVFRNSTHVLVTANPAVSNPIQYTADPLLAGYASEENIHQIAGSPSVTVHAVGGGHAILMIDDPNFRGFWPATSRVFMNAIFFGQLASAPRGRR